MTLAHNQSVMNRSFFSIAADAERIVGQPVHGGLDRTYVVQQPEREAHVVQKQILAEMLHAHKVKTGSIEHFAGLVDPTCATLIDFRQDYPGLIGKPIVTMRCMPMYFAEVDPHDNWVIHHQDMATRLLIARQSGLLFMGCNEAIAVILGHESDESSQIVKAFMTDERGVPRPIHGVYPHDRRIIGSQRQIESLNVHEAESALNEAVRDAAVTAQSTVAAPRIHSYFIASSYQHWRKFTKGALEQSHLLSEAPVLLQSIVWIEMCIELKAFYGRSTHRQETESRKKPCPQ